MANLKREEEGEMSIEEILASIRRYVGDEPQNHADQAYQTPKLDPSYPSPKAEADKTAEALAASLSSTKGESLKDTSSVPSQNYYSPQTVMPSQQYPNSPENVIRLTEAYAVKTEPYSSATKLENNEGILSAQAQAATAQSFARLAEAATHSHHKTEPSSPTLDQLIAELARPMIKQWLDQNLPRLVELTVTKEIERLTKQLRSD